MPREPLTQFLAVLERLHAIEMRALDLELGIARRHFKEHGWVEKDGYLTHTMVPYYDSEEEVEADIDEDAGVYRYQSPQRRWQIITAPLSDITLYAVRLDAFFDHLAQLLEMEPSRATRRRCLVPDHLWYLGDLCIKGSHAFAPVFFGRQLRRAPAGAIEGALLDPIFERGGIVLAYVNADLPLPNGHRLRPFSDFLIPGPDGEQLDLVVFDRVLRGLPADASVEPEEWFDEKSGWLKLCHLPEPVRFQGIQGKIIEIFWKERDGRPLRWTGDVKERSGSIASTLDKAMGGREHRKIFLDAVSRGRYRLHRN